MASWLALQDTLTISEPFTGLPMTNLLSHVPVLPGTSSRLLWPQQHPQGAHPCTSALMLLQGHPAHHTVAPQGALWNQPPTARDKAGAGGCRGQLVQNTILEWEPKETCDLLKHCNILRGDLEEGNASSAEGLPSLVSSTGTSRSSTSQLLPTPDLLLVSCRL